uniref:Uncharacterized protein n=1 Tax=Ananas comosus var. bracteatus TaxID=296719 RepID=A0A6V7PBW0_ANACO|nr:unnamed protein product [Ananas comosus var. bracteatus]
MLFISAYHKRSTRKQTYRYRECGTFSGTIAGGWRWKGRGREGDGRRRFGRRGCRGGGFWVLRHLFGEDTASGDGPCKRLRARLLCDMHSEMGIVQSEAFLSQCKHPFEFLDVHRSLDGCIHDYMFEESVCLLLRATWFVPLKVEAQEEAPEEVELFYQDEYDQDDGGDDFEESYYMGSSSSVRIGNRRWGDGGFVRSGRKQARPVIRQQIDNDDAGPSRCPKKEKEASKDVMGRRAKRALKREAADKAAAAKHQQHLQRLGRI